jgi:hypothetical protein
MKKITCKEMWRIRRMLTPELLADPRLYQARRNLLKAYRRLCAPTNLDDVGHARAQALDAVDLLNDFFGINN